MLQFKAADLSEVRALLCDADGNLFPSEEPAFVASTIVTNRFMQSLGLNREFTPNELRLATTGKNFRTTAVALAASGGVAVEPELASRYPELKYDSQPDGNGQAGRRVLRAAELEQWVEEEKREVTKYLRTALTPDPQVIKPLTQLAQRYALAAVSSSATSRVGACLEVTGLAALFPPDLRFSAEDSLPVPTSKPDPAIYLFAGQRLKISSQEGLAIEDSLPGAQAAVRAGYPTIGNVLFVPPAERPARVEALKEAGVAAVIFSWWELVELLDRG